MLRQPLPIQKYGSQRVHFPLFHDNYPNCAPQDQPFHSPDHTPAMHRPYPLRGHHTHASCSAVLVMPAGGKRHKETGTRLPGVPRAKRQATGPDHRACRNDTQGLHCAGNRCRSVSVLALRQTNRDKRNCLGEQAQMRGTVLGRNAVHAHTKPQQHPHGLDDQAAGPLFKPALLLFGPLAPHSHPSTNSIGESSQSTPQ